MRPLCRISKTLVAPAVCVDLPLAEPQAIDVSTSFREVESSEISLLGSVPCHPLFSVWEAVPERDFCYFTEHNCQHSHFAMREEHLYI